MKIVNSFFLLLFAAFFLAACATSPEFDTTGLDASITPQRAVGESQVLQGQPVLWGGVIIASANLKDVTQLEVLAYPLDANQRPLSEQKPLGRFLALQTGYLEISDYAQGRFVTIKGTLSEKHIGRVGEAAYTYPVVTIDKLYLWSIREGYAEPRIQFGFGLMIHN